jgi:hypothetical protein
MTFDLIFLAILAIAAVTGSVVSIARDGYRRTPSRRV